MSTKRIPWHLLAGLILGIGLGLLFAWVVSPVEYTDTPPSLLRADFKDQYRAAIAAAYISTGDLGRAQTRLALLGDPDPVQALTVQAQRTLAEGGSPETLQALAMLAVAIQQEGTENAIAGTGTARPTRTPRLPTKTGTPATSTPVEIPPTHTPPAPATSTQTFPPPNSPTPRPTRTPTPTLGAPYVLTAQDTICSLNLTEGLLMVYVSNAAGKPVAGAEIIVAWNGGEEHFFTGFKPELGHGYADFVMTPDVAYSLRLADGGASIPDLSAPSCQDENG
ncbi:MAG: hypothetical protein GXP40_01485, partial [Chloroflexi bacterium]|nr:hypothetical protein [Chloroflexota bacterium]